MSLVPRPLRGVLGTDDDLVSQEQAPHLARGRARARAGAIGLGLGTQEQGRGVAPS